MKTIQLIKDKNFNVDFDKLQALVYSLCDYMDVQILEDEYEFNEKLITLPATHKKHRKVFEKLITSEVVILATDVPYGNSYFFEEYDGFIPVSFYGWSRLTSLPKENGMLYWICDLALSTLQRAGEYTVHQKTTGCINDFLGEKSGIDVGMRSARLCRSCLKKFSRRTLTRNEAALFKDIQTMLDYLASKSKWGKSIFDDFTPGLASIKKRKPRKRGEITVMIASPSDTDKEREILLNRLERVFRERNYEKNCKHRVIVSGWEQLAAQAGYAQDIIDARLLNECDVVLGILRHKLGTPVKDTSGKKRADSGTAEEILYAVEKNPKRTVCMVYFYAVAPNPSLDQKDFSQIALNWKRLTKFKKDIQDKVLYKPYASETELLDLVALDLSKNIIDYFDK